MELKVRLAGVWRRWPVDGRHSSTQAGGDEKAGGFEMVSGSLDEVLLEQ